MKDDYACVFLLLSAKFLILLLRFIFFNFFLGKNVLRDHIEKHDQVMEDSRLMKSGSSHNIQNFTIFFILFHFHLKFKFNSSKFFNFASYAANRVLFLLFPVFNFFNFFFRCVKIFS